MGRGVGGEGERERGGGERRREERRGGWVNVRSLPLWFCTSF